jgi:hypothetical protein
MSNNDWLKYNASEYQVGDKVYRNLEAQVLKNKEDIEAFDVSGLEDDVEALQGDVEQLQTDVAGKQDKLTAGSNVTITGNTISATNTTYEAGEGIEIVGNVINAIGGGGGSGGVFFAVKDTTTFSEVQTALANGLYVVVVSNGWIVAALTEIWKTGGTVTNYRFVSTLSSTEVSSFQIYDLNANDVWTTYQSTPMLTSDWGKETVVLLSTGWVSGGGGTYISQTVNITENPIMNSLRTVWVSPLNTQSSTEDYAKYHIICTGQGTGTLTFTSYQTEVPANNISVNVVWKRY